MTRTSLAAGALLTALASSVKEKLLPGAATSDATATVINPDWLAAAGRSTDIAIELPLDPLAELLGVLED
jgi:hypothetical protein